jgi:hypothetical protein
MFAQQLSIGDAEFDRGINACHVVTESNKDVAPKMDL